MKNLLVAVDFSKFTNAVLAEAAELATALDAKLWIIHVTSTGASAYAFDTTQYTDYAPDMLNMTNDVQLARDISAEELKREHRELLGISAKLRNDGIETQALLLKGDPSRLIIDKADELEAEMIILGSHGHGILHKALLGSVSESIIRNAACNVLIVPPKEADKP
ncbi:universal stress protein [Pontiellaceae bacterium B12227]|nr:universal stress protein [Pontiellaceae bacterium B12227]